MFAAAIETWKPLNSVKNLCVSVPSVVTIPTLGKNRSNDWNIKV